MDEVGKENAEEKVFYGHGECGIRSTRKEREGSKKCSNDEERKLMR